MLHEAIDGVVIRARDMGDHDRYLTLLTSEKGRLTVLAKGSRSMRGTQMAVSQLYSYGNYEIYRRGELYILKSGSPNRMFYELCRDIDKINLAAYLCDLAYELTDEGEPAEEMLRLLLNSLYALDQGLYPQEIIKGAFEMRAAAVSGYAPELDACAHCSAAAQDPFYLDVMNGALVCSDCLKRRAAQTKGTGDYDEIREAEVLCMLPSAAHAALRYTVTAPLARLFAFDLKDADDLHHIVSAAETYLLYHLGRGFDSLNFYRTMRQNTEGTKT